MQLLCPIYLKTAGGGSQFVPCGKCNFCLSNRRTEWTFRLKVEQKNSLTAYFITITYDDWNYPTDGKVDKRRLQTFFKDLRNKQDYLSRTGQIRQINGLEWPKFKYYAVGEYGTLTSRAHYHAIMFNIHPDVLRDILQIWGMGHVLVVNCNGATIHYVTKYVVNKDQTDAFSLMSKGLGQAYSVNAPYHRKNSINYVKSEGHTFRMPRYYKDQFFGNHQKAIIAKRTERQIKEKEAKELKRLVSLHHDPERYFIERRQAEHDSIKSKINTRNKF